MPYARRPTFADPDSLFDPTGNVTGIGGASLSPTLDALAGQRVTVAPVPLDPAQRGLLSAYAAAANVPRRFDMAPYGALQSNDEVKINATQAVPIGKTGDGIAQLSMDAKGGARPVASPRRCCACPGSNPYSPFGTDVLLYRNLPEAGVLRQSGGGLQLHAGGTVQGSVKRWLWTVTGNYDRALTPLHARPGRGSDTRPGGDHGRGRSVSRLCGAGRRDPVDQPQPIRRGDAVEQRDGDGARGATAGGRGADDADRDYARTGSNGTLAGSDGPRGA